MKSIKVTLFLLGLVSFRLLAAQIIPTINQYHQLFVFLKDPAYKVTGYVNYQNCTGEQFPVEPFTVPLNFDSYYYLPNTNKGKAGENNSSIRLYKRNIINSADSITPVPVRKHEWLVSNSVYTFTSDDRGRISLKIINSLRDQQTGKVIGLKYEQKKITLAQHIECPSNAIHLYAVRISILDAG